MTWENRLRLILGVLGVFVLVAALTLVFNQRQNQIASYTGAVAADKYTVGADYAGTVVKQGIRQGEAVKKGQPLFVVQSLALKESLSNGLEVPDTDAYRVDAKHGTISYYAVTDGQMTELNARLGNSIAGGSLRNHFCRRPLRAGQLQVGAPRLRPSSRRVSGADTPG